MNFEDNIKNWVLLDNKIKELNDNVRKLRNKKNNITESLYQIANQKNYLNSKINISDGNLKFVELKQTNPISISFLDECLSEIIPNEEQKNKVIEYIKNKRNSKIIREIKRTYN